VCGAVLRSWCGGGGGRGGKYREGVRRAGLGFKILITHIQVWCVGLEVTRCDVM
jgi:hypothetical protein